MLLNESYLINNFDHLGDLAQLSKKSHLPSYQPHLG